MTAKNSLIMFFFFFVTGCCVPCNKKFQQKIDSSGIPAFPITNSNIKKLNKKYVIKKSNNDDFYILNEKCWIVLDREIVYNDGCYRTHITEWDTTVNALFKNGCKVGRWDYQYPLYKNDSIQRRTVLSEFYCRGWLHGPYAVYDTTGNKLYQTRFKNGSGYKKNYTLNGHLVSEGAIQRNQKIGKWIYYDSTTAIIDTIIYH